MARRGRPKRTELERAIVRAWMSQVCAETGVQSGEEFAKEILKRPDQARTWTGYETGMHFPNGPHVSDGPASSVMLADQHAPGTANFITSIVWTMLGRDSISDEAIGVAIRNLPVGFRELLFEDAHEGCTETREFDPVLEGALARNVSFLTLECLVLVRELARRNRDRRSEDAVSACFSRLRPSLIQLPCFAKLADVFFPLFDNHMKCDKIYQPKKAATSPSSQRGTAESKTISIRVGALLTATLLLTSLVFANDPSFSKVVLILFPLLACIAVAADRRAFNYRGTHFWDGNRRNVFQ